jgi:hypothetical protein
MASSHKGRTKTKNKIGSPSPSTPQTEYTSSQGFDLSGAAEESGDSNNEKGIPHSLEVQLLEDIEASGGIERILLGVPGVLASLLNKKPDIYGLKTEVARRKSIRNRVYKYKTAFKAARYSELLKAFKIDPYQARPKKQPTKNLPAEDSSNDTDSSFLSSGSESDAGTVPRSVARALNSKQTPAKQTPVKQTPVKQTPVKQTPVKQTPVKQTPVARSLHEELQNLTMDDSPSRRDLAIPSDAEHIRVNAQCPEKNGIFMILPVNGIEGVEAKKVFPGFAMIFEIDIRHALDSSNDKIEYFSARTFSPNKVLIRIPSWSYCLYTNTDRIQLEAQLKPNFMNALDAKRNSFNDDKEQRMWRHFVLEFEPYHQLSARSIYKEAGDDDNLARKFLTVKYTHPGMNGKHNVKHFMCFWVARVEQGAEQHGASSNHETMTANALKDLGGDGGF